MPVKKKRSGKRAGRVAVVKESMSAGAGESSDAGGLSPRFLLAGMGNTAGNLIDRTKMFFAAKKKSEA
jgi:hypothetical protein